MEVDEVDKAAVRADVYELLASGQPPRMRQAASQLAATLLLDEAEQHAKVRGGEAEGRE